MAFPAVPKGVRLARRLTTARLTEWGYVPDLPSLLVGELAANAAAHAAGPDVGGEFELRLAAAAGMLRVEVTDGGTDRRPVLRVPGPDEVSGRGLLLVDALAVDWGVVNRPAGKKTVWCLCALAPTVKRVAE